MAQKIVIFLQRFAIISHDFPQLDCVSQYPHEENREVEGQCCEVEGQCREVEGQRCGIYEENCEVEGQCRKVEGHKADR